MNYQNPLPVTRIHFLSPSSNMHLQHPSGEGFGSIVADDSFEGTANKIAASDLALALDPARLVFQNTTFVPGETPTAEVHFTYTLNPLELAAIPAEYVWSSDPSSTYASKHAPTVDHPTIPVAVGIIEHPTDETVLIGERGIEPAIGRRALFGGYTEMETLEDAVLREVDEESGVHMSCTPEYFGSALGHNSRLLVFYRMRAAPEEVSMFKPSPEMRALHWESSSQITEAPLVFPLHQAFALRALEARRLEHHLPLDTPNF